MYTHTAVTLPPEFTASQDWDAYTPENHGMWNFLYSRQRGLIENRACQEYLDGVDLLGLTPERIPNYGELSAIMYKKTGWRIAVVPCFIPADLFFSLLAQRHFPATAWIRSPQQMDYLPEPDMFHDVFGHFPLLVHPTFADYLCEFGKCGVRAMGLGQAQLDMIQRLYWFTVEFGLVNTHLGPRIYGAGILSSKGESIYALEDKKPHHLRFQLERVMRTTYRIDEYQKTYFVIDSFLQLFNETMQDFKPLYDRVPNMRTIPWNALDTADQVIQTGTVLGEADDTKTDPEALMATLNKTRAEREKKGTA
jgi:phenylalanine-4-hydroxylase